MAITLNKQQLHSAIIATLKGLVENAQSALNRAYEAATHEENIAENKYDTLGLEASYLTQGQARRLTECLSDLEAFEALTVKNFSEHDPIAIGALIQLLDGNDREHRFFLGPAAGGVKVQCDGIDVVIITPSAPLGKALLKTRLGDDVEVQIAGKSTLYEIIGIG